MYSPNQIEFQVAKLFSMLSASTWYSNAIKIMNAALQEKEKSCSLMFSLPHSITHIACTDFSVYSYIKYQQSCLKDNIFLKLKSVYVFRASYNHMDYNLFLSSEFGIRLYQVKN